jgi:alkenylglycerophosphocholine/alkenylglycerophosphoethanolamine hydrolase
MTAVLLVALAVVGAANWWSRARNDRRTEAITKPAFTVLAAALCAVHGDGAPMAIALIGFALCLIGDVALLPAVDRFIVGLASFLAGHLAFIVAFVAAGLDEPWLAPVAAVLLVPVLAGPGRRILAASGALKGPVTGYLVIISAMAIVAWATGRPAAMIGAAAFVASDTILGWAKFVGERRWTPVAVMITYHAALTALALSFS